MHYHKLVTYRSTCILLITHYPLFGSLVLSSIWPLLGCVPLKGAFWFFVTLSSPLPIVALGWICNVSCFQRHSETKPPILSLCHCTLHWQVGWEQLRYIGFCISNLGLLTNAGSMAISKHSTWPKIDTHICSIIKSTINLSFEHIFHTHVSRWKHAKVL